MKSLVGTRALYSVVPAGEGEDGSGARSFRDVATGLATSDIFTGPLGSYEESFTVSLGVLGSALH